MLDNIKKYKSYIIIAFIAILIILVYILKQTTDVQISDCNDPDCLEHKNDIEKTYIVYNFSSELCTYCDMMDPIYNKMKEEYGSNLDFKYVDVDEEYTLTNKYKIQYTPTFIIVDNTGKVVDKKVGFVPEGEFREFIDKWGSK